MSPDRVCHCGHRKDEHCIMTADSSRCIACTCLKFRPRIIATTRQITGLPYLHHAYVQDGSKVVMSCTHHHGERRSVQSNGAISAQACADRMLRKYLKRGHR